MLVTETLSDGLRRSFNVVVPAAEIEGKCRTKLAELGRTVKLPGFRPGKVPVNLIRQRYGASVVAEIMQEELTSATDALIEERGLRTAGQPKIALAAAPKIDAGPAPELAFNVDLELLPEITIPDLTALKLTRLKSELAPEKLEETLQTIAAQQKATEPVEEDRPAETGDILKVDFLGKVDGVPFEGGAGTDVDVELGGTGFIPGFADQCVGMKPGESRTINVTFPAEYHSAAMAGKDATFDITAKALLRPVATAIDDELAKKLGFESLEKVRELLTQQMTSQYDQLSRLRLKRDLLDALAAQAQFPAPPTLVETEFAAIWARVEADIKAGREDDEDKGRDPEALKAEYRAIADRRVRLGLLLSEIGRAANIAVSQAELTNALRQEAARYPGQEMQVVEFYRKNAQAVEQLRGPIFEDKVVDHILAQAQLEERLVTPEELNAAAEETQSTTPSLADQAIAAAAAEAAPAIETEVTASEVSEPEVAETESGAAA